VTDNQRAVCHPFSYVQYHAGAGGALPLPGIHSYKLTLDSGHVVPGMRVCLLYSALLSLGSVLVESAACQCYSCCDSCYNGKSNSCSADCPVATKHPPYCSSPFVGCGGKSGSAAGSGNDLPGKGLTKEGCFGMRGGQGSLRNETGECVCSTGEFRKPDMCKSYAAACFL
jgi:hypothetical protein